MFGRPQAPPKDWDSLYFYQKVQHLVDHVSDFVVSKCNWWLPAVGLGMGLSILIFGGADGPASAVFMANSTLLPYVPLRPFKSPDDDMPMGGEEEEEEF